MHSAQAACGERLRTMRMEARYTQKEAVTLANEVAEEEGISERFTLRALRRWELLGTAAHNPSNHGTTPPTLRELYVLLRVYSGSPSYLLLGLEPPLYPMSEYGSYKAALFKPEMIEVMNELARWSAPRRQLFIEFFREFVRR